MKKLNILVSAAIIMVMLLSILTGCTYNPARRFIQTDPNNQTNLNNRADQNNAGLPNNLVGRNGDNTGNNMISATYENVDFSNLTIDGDGCNVRAGAGTKYPSIGKISSDQNIRALGKLDGWYVIKMPDSGKIGCIPSANAKPTGAGVGTPTNPNMTTGTGTVTPAPAPRTTTGGGTTGAGTTGAGTTAAGSGTMSSDEARILQLVNAERAKTGAKPLVSNSDCTKLARMKSQDMVNKNYFSHQSPTYGSPFDMLKSNNVSYMYAGENIAMNQSADAAFQAWMNSEGHKKNILNPNFTDLGVGIAPKGNGSNIYTQTFIGK